MRALDSPHRQRATIALVSRQVWPFHEGGGLGRSVCAMALALAPVADVTLLLPDRYRGKLPGTTLGW